MQCSPCIRLLLAADGPPQLLVVHDGRLLDVQGRHQLLPVIVAQAAHRKNILKIFGRYQKYLDCIEAQAAIRKVLMNTNTRIYQYLSYNKPLPT